MTTKTADWANLPHDPASFFSLQPGFDRRDLKRAYGKLIRQYKPETHPEEFQKIRGAFETLESQLRYGVQQNLAAAQQRAWANVADSAPKAKAATSDSTEPSPRALMNAAAKRPRETFAKLANKADKSPQEFFLLAILSDLVKSDPPQDFAVWLLRGLRAHPSDPGLQSMVQSYLREEVQLKNAAVILQRCATVLPAREFYRLTEPLWGRLLRESRFSSFAQVLEKCEEKLRNRDEVSRASFYLQLMRPAVFRANATWLDHASRIVETASLQLDPASLEEVDLIESLRSYLNATEGVSASPTQARIDEMIRSYCLDPPAVMISRVVGIQDELARDSHSMIRDFPVAASAEHMLQLLPVYAHIINDVVEQAGLEFPETSQRKIEKLAHSTVRDLGESLAPIGGKLSRQQIMGYVPPFLALTVLPPAILAFGIPMTSTVLTLSILWFGVTAVIFATIIKPRYLDPRAEEKVQRTLRGAYETHWRARMFRYVQSTGVAPEVSLRKLEEAAKLSGASDWMELVLALMSEDYSLLLFGRAQLFVT